MTQHKKFLPCLLASAAALSFSHSAYADDAYLYGGQSSRNDYSLGIEGFHELYREPGADVTFTTNYGSITGRWVHEFADSNVFTALDGRYSTGTDSYKSSSGTYSGAREDETDDRVRIGMNFGPFSPYVGLGLRYFIDNGKGQVSDLGAHAYDRRITQFYAPIGVSYSYTTEGNMTITPNFEVDPLLYGNVNTRLGNITGLYNINNSQHTGFGLRGEVMAGWQYRDTELQVGPFVRYWKINDSATTTDPIGNTWIEPHNTRLQYGLALQLRW